MERKRDEILSNRFFLPNFCAKIATIAGFLWILGCALTVIVLGINFDLESERSVSEDTLLGVTSLCDEDVDVSFRSAMNLKSTVAYISAHPSEVGKLIYGENTSDSIVFLVNSALGLILGMFITSPLITMLFSCVRIAKFRVKATILPEDPRKIDASEESSENLLIPGETALKDPLAWEEEMFINNPTYMLVRLRRDAAADEYDSDEYDESDDERL